MTPTPQPPSGKTACLRSARIVPRFFAARPTLALALALTSVTRAVADERWDPQFTDTNAPDASVGALAFSGTNLYVGGAFATAGGVTVNRTARWDGGQWTALGSGVSGGNVFAIATQGSNVFVGGGFSSAGTRRICFRCTPLSRVKRPYAVLRLLLEVRPSQLGSGRDSSPGRGAQSVRDFLFPLGPAPGCRR
jgi:hypothetical protein